METQIAASYGTGCGGVKVILVIGRCQYLRTRSPLISIRAKTQISKAYLDLANWLKTRKFIYSLHPFLAVQVDNTLSVQGSSPIATFGANHPNYYYEQQQQMPFFSWESLMTDKVSRSPDFSADLASADLTVAKIGSVFHVPACVQLTNQNAVKDKRERETLFHNLRHRHEVLGRVVVTIGFLSRQVIELLGS